MISIFPVSTLNYYRWFQSKEIQSMNSALLSLALSTKWREKLYPKLSKRVIFLSWAAAISKALGESVALRWFLSSDSYLKPFASLRDFLGTQTHTISSLISSFYFSEGGGKTSRESMFVFGSALLVVSFSLNYLLMRKGTNYRYKNNYLKKKASTLKFSILHKLERLKFSKSSVYFSRYLAFPFHDDSWIQRELKRDRWRSRRDHCVLTLVIGFFALILLIIALRGIYFIFFNLFRGFTESYTVEGLLVPLWNTLLLLFFSITWSLPIAFFAAFFVSAYISKWRRLKYLLSSFISGCGTVPPMLWALFGSFLFLDYLKLSLGRVSIFAGILTLTLLNLPYLFGKFFNLFEGYLKKYSVPLLRLGLSSYYLFFIVVKDGLSSLKDFISGSITRLNGESGLLFITIGASESSRLTLWGHGQTLTTKIFTTLLKYKITDIKSVIYETIFCFCALSLFLYSLFNSFWSLFFRRMSISLRKRQLERSLIAAYKKKKSASLAKLASAFPT
ncbi:phosphate ABC transporter permease [Candidatus Mycoplasma haematolamae str. Purdue]|uniref:Phosphate ABC transporter permease n=1 Tax=Mycoplasma haematolamae (strain Purdue) TaxID=1212765 RepID=I7CFP5_MYCHA|nr:phosphate ABC transporter permease [Candidatus Mycoplasma haematolamae str. Purdue]